MQKKTLIGLLIIIFLLSYCSSQQVAVVAPRAVEPGQKAKNIILLIGDGMGLPQISAAVYSSNKPLSFERFPVVGLHKQQSANDLITDSAAGATAFACGIKTYNGAIGVDLDSVPVKSILEEAEEKGLSTGLIATSSITHATPAAFIAHQFNRVLNEAIAADFLNTEIDYFVGGGKKYFDRRSDERNLIKELENKQYLVADFLDREMEGASPDPERNFAYFTADTKPLPVGAGRNYLSFATRQGMYFLEQRSQEGFFMMVEGSQIDWGGHANDGDYAISELLDFDRAIQEALNFAEKKGNTLVIVTTDHECGGMAIDEHSKMGRMKYKFTTPGHTASMVPIFAYGPGAELFEGIYQNNEIYFKMQQALGWLDPVTADKN